jgi:anti-anti-sigma factor
MQSIHHNAMASGSLTISLPANLDVRNVDAVRGQILALEVVGRELVIDARAVTRFSTAGLQLLLAARAHAQTLGGTLRIHEPSTILENALLLAGCSDLLKTSRTSGP